MTRIRQVGRALLTGLVVCFWTITGSSFYAYADPPLAGDKVLIRADAWRPAVEASQDSFLVVYEAPQPLASSTNIRGTLVTMVSEHLVVGNSVPIGAQEVCKPDNPDECCVPNQHYAAVGFEAIVLQEFWVYWADNRDNFLKGPDYPWSIYWTSVDPVTGDVGPDDAFETAGNEQTYPAVAPDVGLVAWQDSRANPSEPRIMGSTPIIGEFPVSPFWDLGQDQNPAVGVNRDHYLVAWKFFDYSGENSGIYGRMADEIAGLIGDPFLITDDLSNIIDIASDGNNFLVVWDGHVGAYRRIMWQLVSYEGALVGSPYVWPSGTNMFYPAAAFDGSNYLVVWQRDTYDQNRGIWGCWVSTDGQPIGDPFQIAAFGLDMWTGEGPDVAFCPSINRYLVVWDEQTDMKRLYAQLIEPAGPPRLTLSEGPANPHGALIPPDSNVALMTTQIKLDLDSSAEDPAEISSMTFSYAGNADMGTITGAGLLHDPTCGGVDFYLIDTADFSGNTVTFDGLTQTILPATETCYAVYYGLAQGAICPCTVYGASIGPDNIQAALPGAPLEMAGSQVTGTVQVDYPEIHIVGKNVISAKRNELLSDPLLVSLTQALPQECQNGWQARFTIDQAPAGAVGQALGCGGPECVVPFDNMGEAGTSFFTGDVNGAYVITAVQEPSPANPYDCPQRPVPPLTFTVEVECYLLSISTDPQGAGSVDQWPFDACYDSGEIVTLTALPASGYIFDHWEGAVSGSTNPGSVTMNEDKHVTAVFMPGTSPLEADFSAEPVTGVPPLEVQFTDLSSGAVTGWRWDFGDGQNSTSQNPLHTYQTGGIYTVSLTVAGPGGADTETKTDYITVQQVMPLPDIKVNGSDGPVVLGPSQPAAVTIALNPGIYAGYSADWWVAVRTPFTPPGDWYTYVHPTGWRTGVSLCAQTALFELSPIEVLNTVLPVGNYTFYFAVDPPDGQVSGEVMDSVQVKVE